MSPSRQRIIHGDLALEWIGAKPSKKPLRDPRFVAAN
jgi:hypothetical protein